MVQKLAIGINLILAVLIVALSLFVGEVLMSGIEWVGITVWTSMILGLLAYTYGEMKKLNLRQIIMSVGLSLIIATPAGGLWGILTLSILLEFGFLSCCLAVITCLDEFISAVLFGAIGGGLLTLILSTMYYKNSGLKPSSSEKRKNNEKTKRY